MPIKRIQVENAEGNMVFLHGTDEEVGSQDHNTTGDVVAVGDTNTSESSMEKGKDEMNCSSGSTLDTGFTTTDFDVVATDGQFDIAVNEKEVPEGNVRIVEVTNDDTGLDNNFQEETTCNQDLNEEVDVNEQAKKGTCTNIYIYTSNTILFMSFA